MTDRRPVPPGMTNHADFDMTPTTRTLTRRGTLGVTLLAAVALGTAAQTGRRARSDLLVTSDWLAGQINNPKLVLLHVGEKEEYDAGHIPGARLVDLHDVSAPMNHSDTTELALEMSSGDELRKQLEALGISDDSRVVVYYGKDWLSPSTRVLLTLQYVGL